MSDNSVNLILFETGSNYSDDDQSNEYFSGGDPIMKKRKRKNSDVHKRVEKGRPADAEKMIMAGFVKEERLLWDKLDEQYYQYSARNEAWTRIAEKMPGRDISDLKDMWKSLLDNYRHRKNKKWDTADRNLGDWKYKDCLSFIHERFTQRKSLSSETSEIIHTKDSASDSHHIEKTSNLSTSGKDSDPLSSVAPQTSTEPPLEYLHVWQHLERLYQKLNDEDIEEFNIQFINQAYEKTKSK